MFLLTNAEKRTFGKEIFFSGWGGEGLGEGGGKEPEERSCRTKAASTVYAEHFTSTRKPN